MAASILFSDTTGEKVRLAKANRGSRHKLRKPLNCRRFPLG
jgi:hypothetical protein